MTGSVVFPYSGTLWHAVEQEGGGGEGEGVRIRSDGARPTRDRFRVSEATAPHLVLWGVRYMLCATVKK